MKELVLSLVEIAVEECQCKCLLVVSFSCNSVNRHLLPTSVKRFIAKLINKFFKLKSADCLGFCSLGMCSLNVTVLFSVGLVVAGNANLESLRIPNLSLVDQSKCHEMSKGKITIYANPKLKRENVILHEYMKDVVFFDESEKFDESLKPQRQPIDRRSSG